MLLAKSMEAVAWDAPPIHLAKQDLSVAEFLDALGEEERRKLIRILEEAGVQTIEASGEVALVGVLGQDIGDFAISRAVYREWVEHTLSVAAGMSNTVSMRLVEPFSDVISSGLVAGDTRATIARKLGEAAREVYESLSLKHAAMVAHTETHGATNYGTLQGYAWGGTETKEWMHFPGSSKQPRATHATADGQMRKIDEPFLVGGEQLMFPGDYNGSFANTHWCAVDPGTPVLTRTGWAGIADIEPGEMVLTHRRRYRPVIRTFRNPGYSGEVVALRGAGQPSTIRLTPNHGIRAVDGWTPASDVKAGELVRTLSDHGTLPLRDGRLAARRSETATGVTRYNLEVEEDHSYIAGGVVISNCHCQMMPGQPE